MALSKSIKPIIGLLISFFVLAACAPEATEQSATKDQVDANLAAKIFLVRHAEKRKDQDDPELSEPGFQRAGQLAERLKDEGITYITSTDYRRTLQTAAPLAEMLALEVVLYDPSDLNMVAAALKEQGGAMLVVGHSNTTPQLSEALGGTSYGPIYEPTEYDRLYTVRIDGEGNVTTELERFGTLYEAEMSQ